MHVRYKTEEEKFYSRYIKPLEKWTSYVHHQEAKPSKFSIKCEYRFMPVRVHSTSTNQSIKDISNRRSIDIKMKALICKKNQITPFFKNYQKSLLTKFKNFNKSIDACQCQFPNINNRKKISNFSFKLKQNEELYCLSAYKDDPKKSLPSQFKSIIQKITHQRNLSAQKTLQRCSSDIRKKFKFATINDEEDEDKMEIINSIDQGQCLISGTKPSHKRVILTLPEL